MSPFVCTNELATEERDVRRDIFLRGFPVGYEHLLWELFLEKVRGDRGPLVGHETRVCDSECNTLIERLANGRWDSEFGVGSVLGMRSGIVQDVEGNHREVKAGSMLRAFSGVQLELI